MFLMFPFLSHTCNLVATFCPAAKSHLFAAPSAGGGGDPLLSCVQNCSNYDVYNIYDKCVLIDAKAGCYV